MALLLVAGLAVGCGADTSEPASTTGPTPAASTTSYLAEGVVDLADHGYRGLINSVHHPGEGAWVTLGSHIVHVTDELEVDRSIEVDGEAYAAELDREGTGIALVTRGPRYDERMSAVWYERSRAEERTLLVEDFLSANYGNCSLAVRGNTAWVSLRDGAEVVLLKVVRGEGVTRRLALPSSAHSPGSFVCIEAAGDSFVAAVADGRVQQRDWMDGAVVRETRLDSGLHGGVLAAGFGRSWVVADGQITGISTEGDEAPLRRRYDEQVSLTVSRAGVVAVTADYQGPNDLGVTRLAILDPDDLETATRNSAPLSLDASAGDIAGAVDSDVVWLAIGGTSMLQRIDAGSQPTER